MLLLGESLQKAPRLFHADLIFPYMGTNFSARAVAIGQGVMILNAKRGDLD